MSKKKKNKKKKVNVGNLKRIQQTFEEGVGFHQGGQLRDALLKYEEVLKFKPDHSDALYLSGAVFHQLGHDQDAVDFILNAIRLDSENHKYYSTLVRVYNNLGLFHHEQGALEEAIASYRKALDIDPEFSLAWNNLGLIYEGLGDFSNAEKYYKKAVTIDKGFYEAWVNLGNVNKANELYDDSLACYEKALNINSSSWQAYNNAGTVFKILNEFETALSHFRKAVELKPDYSDAYYNLGCLYQDKGNTEQAVVEYKACIQYNPAHEKAYQNLGNVFVELKDYSNALEQYVQAISLSPLNPENHNNIGNLYQQQNELEQALFHISKAIELSPDSAEFSYNYGLLLKKTGAVKEAKLYLNKSIQLRSDYSAPYYHLGEIYIKLNQFRKAVECYEKAVQIDPDFEAAYDNLAYSYQRLCDWEKSNKYQQIIIEITDIAISLGEPVVETPHNCLLRRDDPHVCYLVAKSKSEQIAESVADYPNNFNFTNRQNKKIINIGYLSNSFSDHPGGHLIAGLFGFHNRDQFKIICYSYGPDDKSYYRKKVETESDLFIDITGISDEKAAELIFTDEIDILIDLRGDTGGSRNRICAMRPAPVQVVYLGFPGTSGAGFYDYIIADKTVVPESHQQFFSEKIVYMPDCYQVNNNQQEISEKEFCRKKEDLPEEKFIFCCFNTEYKIEPVMFDCWMNILHRVPDSLLWLLTSGDEMEQNLINEAINRGLNSSRLIFTPHLPKDEHLKRCQLADIALDTRIVNGHTSTSDMLWAGLPVITLLGKHFSSRVSASILNAAGLSELITNSIEEYEELAVTIASDKEINIKLREKVNENRGTEPLFDTQLFTDNLEKAYCLMWDQYVNDKKQDVINV